jgi:pimeloyl-ACP methyl ester carboxylesterase
MSKNKGNGLVKGLFTKEKQMLNFFSYKKSTINGVEINYIDEGKGFPIVLLHGFPQSSYVWRNIIPGLKREFRVIAPDFRGMGGSQYCQIGQDKKTLANDIIQLIKHLNIRKFIVVGHDWGGSVAQRLALEYPEYLLGMISMGIPYMPTAKIDELCNPRQIFNNWYFFFHQVRGLPEIFISKAGKEYLKWMMEYGSSKKKMVFDDADLEVYSRHFCDENRISAYLNLYRTLFTVDPKDWKPFVNNIVEVPTQWILAAEDPFVPPHMSININEKFKNIQIKTFNDCGHWIPE